MRLTSSWMWRIESCIDACWRFHDWENNLVSSCIKSGAGNFNAVEEVVWTHFLELIFLVTETCSYVGRDWWCTDPFFVEVSSCDGTMKRVTKFWVKYQDGGFGKMTVFYGIHCRGYGFRPQGPTRIIVSRGWFDRFGEWGGSFFRRLGKGDRSVVSVLFSLNT